MGRSRGRWLVLISVALWLANFGVTAAHAHWRTPFVGTPPISQRFHEGRAIDFRLGHGQEVLAAADGVVIRAVRTSGGYTGWGTYVQIRHEDGSVSTYAHLSELSVPECRSDQGCTPVAKGDVIGRAGNSGNVLTYKGGRWVRPTPGSTEGSHLHFFISNSVDTKEATGEKHADISYMVDWDRMMAVELRGYDWIEVTGSDPPSGSEIPRSGGAVRLTVRYELTMPRAEVFAIFQLGSTSVFSGVGTVSRGTGERDLVVTNSLEGNIPDKLLSRFRAASTVRVDIGLGDDRLEPIAIGQGPTYRLR